MKLVSKVMATILLFVSQFINATEVMGLYEAEVITKSQSREDRNDAIKAAFEIVISKVMAGENIFADAAVKIALADAAHYVKQYQYSLIPANIDSNTSARVMRVQFDEKALLELMRTSELGIWSEIRDETLVWLVVDKAGKQQFYNENLMPELANALGKASKRKGLPLLFPLLDLEEQQELTVHDVLSAYSKRLLVASERYDTVAILSGRVHKKHKCWSGEWTFYFNDEINQWAEPCGLLDQVILSGMQGAYDQLSRYYSVKPEVLEIGTLILQVAEIKGMTDMTLVTEYLEALPMVESVSWLKVVSGENIYKVKFSGSQQAFENMLGLGRVLDPVRTSSSAQSKELEYRLLKQKK